MQNVATKWKIWHLYISSITSLSKRISINLFNNFINRRCFKLDHLLDAITTNNHIMSIM